jgi:hypothetical protein
MNGIGEYIRSFLVSSIFLKKRIEKYIEDLIENGYIDEDELLFSSVQTLEELSQMTVF